MEIREPEALQHQFCRTIVDVLWIGETFFVRFRDDECNNHYSTAFWSLVMVRLAIMLIPGWGAIGAAMAITVGQFVVCIVVAMPPCKRFSMPFPAKDIAAIGASGLGVWIANAAFGYVVTHQWALVTFNGTLIGGTAILILWSYDLFASRHMFARLSSAIR